MHNHRHSVGRNFLRVFEIALFFVVSVLGYGLMMQASTFNARSKTRVQTPGLQSTSDQQGNNRGLSVIPGNLIFPEETQISTSRSDIVRSIEAFYVLQNAALLTAMHQPSLQYPTTHDRTPFPHNLLQQNPVLLI
jgi:hypothetical protein